MFSVGIAAKNNREQTEHRQAKISVVIGSVDQSSWIDALLKISRNVLFRRVAFQLSMWSTKLQKHQNVQRVLFCDQTTERNSLMAANFKGCENKTNSILLCLYMIVSVTRGQSNHYSIWFDSPSENTERRKWLWTIFTSCKRSTLREGFMLSSFTKFKPFFSQWFGMLLVPNEFTSVVLKKYPSQKHLLAHACISCLCISCSSHFKVSGLISPWGCQMRRIYMSSRGPHYQMLFDNPQNACYVLNARRTIERKRPHMRRGEGRLFGNESELHVNRNSTVRPQNELSC